MAHMKGNLAYIGVCLLVGQGGKSKTKVADLVTALGLPKAQAGAAQCYEEAFMFHRK